jgi:hypothetical protein
METKNKITHKWSMIAHSSAVDTESNSFSIFNVIDEINGEIVLSENDLDKPFINIPIDFELISLWEKIDLNSKEELRADVEMSFEIKGEKQSPTKHKINYELIIPSNKRRMRLRTKINGLAVKKTGIHIFKIFIKENGTNKFKKAGEVLLPVNISVKKNSNKE